MTTFESFDGVTLHYDEEGDGDVVVLLHGFAADTNINWIRPGIFDALCDEGYRVVTLDARGHGLSEKPHDAESYADGAMVRDVQSLIDEIGCDRCAVVGFSMGAMTTMRLLQVEPRVRRAALLGVGSVTLMSGGERRDFLAEAMLAEDPASIADPIAAEFRRLADSVRADRLALAAWAQSADAGHTDGLDSIGVPVIVIAGEDDMLAGTPDALAQQIPGARAVTVPGDHFTANAQPALHRALIDFLAE